MEKGNFELLSTGEVNKNNDANYRENEGEIYLQTLLKATTWLEVAVNIKDLF